MNNELDILVSRVVDKVASKADWEALEAMALSDPGVWRELAAAQRMDQQLSGEVWTETAAALWVSLPSATADLAAGRAQQRSRLVAMWGGWAAAAAIALAFVGQRSERGAPAGGTELTGANLPGMDLAATDLVPIRSASDALRAYLDRGRLDGLVIGELPDKVLVQTRPIANGGGMEVVYLRQIVERARVDDLYRPTTDELGNVTGLPVRVTPASERGWY